MRVSIKMERTIKQLAAKHDVDLTRLEAYLQVRLDPYMPLAIYNAGMNTVRVRHINREWQSDPEIVFWTGSSAGWVAIEITQLVGGQRSYALLNDECSGLVSLDVARQASLTSFAEMWAQNIIDQGFLETGVKSPERFPLGHVVATPGAMVLLQKYKVLPQTVIERHVRCDWGELDEYDFRQNEEALEVGNRLLSRYVIAPGAILWLITEWDRSATTLLLPSEY